MKVQPKFGIYLFNPKTSEFTLLPDSRGLKEPRWSPDGRFIAALDESSHRLLLYDFQNEKWKSLGEGGLLGIPYWADDSSAVYFQDQLEKEQSVFRLAVQGGVMQRIYSFGDVLGSSAHYLFKGMDPNGSLYVTEERGLTDIYALDLDLP